ncbi:hypothetical protein BH23BAC3_BH23BAC3_13480 [soil metagenome]
MEKTCLCTNLGTGSLIRLGNMKPSYGRQAICPGPNVAWFDRQYTLDEMVGHIYGRRESLVPEERPHMFANEMTMYVDYVSEIAAQISPDDKQQWRKLGKMRNNLEKGMDLCLEISESKLYEDENLDSLRDTVNEQRLRLTILFETRMAEA